MGRERLSAGNGRPGRGIGGGGARWTSVSGAGGCARGGTSMRVARSQAISLRVSGISPGGGGWACSAAAVTLRKARASMARVTHRYQEAQVRTWCSSRPARPLPAWKFSSVPADPGDAHQGGQRNGLRRPAAVEGKFAGAAVAADQQPAMAGTTRSDGYPGPGVPALPLGARPADSLAGLRRAPDCAPAATPAKGPSLGQARAEFRGHDDVVGGQLVNGGPAEREQRGVDAAA